MSKTRKSKAQPGLYGEYKQSSTYRITPTAKSGLQDLAAGLGIAPSEMIERIGRGLLPLNLDIESLGELPANCSN